MGIAFLTSGVLATALALAQQGPPEDRIYGRVETVRGEVHVGFIHWGRTGGVWGDLMGGYKELSRENMLQARRLRAEADPEADRAARSVVYNGVRITWDEDDTEVLPDTTQSGVRFGHVRRVVPAGENAAHLVLKSGLEVDLASAGRRTPFIDTVSVELAPDRVVPVAWGEVASVEFQAAPTEASPRDTRIHGTVRVRGGDSFTGYLVFGALRLYTSDPYSGAMGSRTSGVPFSDIERLVWTQGSSTATATLSDGQTVTLRDALSGNRPLRIADAALGGVQLPISRVEEIRFHAPESGAGYDAFDGARRIRGTVVTRDGERHTGFIRWDNDEDQGWEILNGSDGSVTFTVEMAKVQSIAIDTPRAVHVTLWDGRELDLSGSNDVGPQNKGIVIERDDGTFRFVDWLGLDSVEMERP